MKSKIVKAIRQPWRILVCSQMGKLRDFIPDKLYLKLMYHACMDRKLNLDSPKTYNEKLQWLKLYDHNPCYTTMVDKYAVKKFVADIIGEEYIIETLGVWNSFEEIDFNELPDKFVLKCTHDSAGLIICKDKKSLDIQAARRKMKRCLSRNFFYSGREWPYKNVQPRIIAEKYMEDSTYKELRDYKFFTFNGEPKVLYIAQGRGLGKTTTSDFYDMDFNHLPFTIDHDMAKQQPEKPLNFDLMKKLAKALSEGTPQLRVDFYEVDGCVYFGELTFFHCSGFNRFNPDEWDERFGDWVELPRFSNHK